MAVDLPWKTTYNCADWNEYVDPYNLGPTNCDGLEKALDSSCSPGGHREWITSDANFLYGEGGKGQRHWVGDGQNIGSGGSAIRFNKAEPELWIRWYIRWQSGFKWSALIYEKILYIHTSNNHAPGSGDANVVPEWYGFDTFSIAVDTGPAHPARCDKCGWDSVMVNGGDDGNGHKTSDGQWHCFETHIKMDTNGSNGIAEQWIDGIQKISKTNINFGTKAGWISFYIASNHSYPANGGCVPVDFDDIAINNTGYIGPLTGTVNFDSTPSGADVYLNGINTGLKTPCSINTPVGNRPYAVKLLGFDDVTGTTDVFANQTSNVIASFGTCPEVLVTFNIKEV
jgi:hypothetical protein